MKWQKGRITTFDSIIGMDLSEWMQFTGLKDKNGNPIYEGDIVKESGGDTDVVEFVYGCFTVHGSGAY